MKRIYSLYTISVLLLTTTLNAQIIIDHERYNRLLERGDCSTLVDETVEIRSSEEYGKNWMIDYYIAMGLCCLEEAELAEDVFSYIDSEYPDNKELNEFVAMSQASCGPQPVDSELDELARILVANWSGGSEPSFVKGKLGYVLNCKQDIGQYQFNPAFNQSELQKRLFEIDEVDSAIQYYSNSLPSGKYNIGASGRFIYVTPSNKSLEDRSLRDITGQLEKAYQFMVNYYQVRPPDKLITVYLMGNKQRLAEVARDTHGLEIPEENYGYSNLADLSVLGNSTSKGLGTIMHELFHLIIRTDIGDIPGWLDEGIACLYEESHWENDTLLRSNENVWRTWVLRSNDKTNSPLPFLSTIIENNWSEFMPNSATSICDLSINYAMAKHFAMYLERQDLLPKVVTAFKERKNVLVDTSYSNESSISILENALGKKMPVIQSEFDQWLKANYRISARRDISSIKNRLERLYRDGMRYECEEYPGFAEIEDRYHLLLAELNETMGSEVSLDLLTRCMDLISDAENMALDCYRHWRERELY